MQAERLVKRENKAQSERDLKKTLDPPIDIALLVTVSSSFRIIVVLILFSFGVFIFCLRLTGSIASLARTGSETPPSSPVVRLRLPASSSSALSVPIPATKHRLLLPSSSPGCHLLLWLLLLLLLLLVHGQRSRQSLAQLQDPLHLALNPIRALTPHHVPKLSRARAHRPLTLTCLLRRRRCR
jgi:hypothetical protein